MPVTAKLQTTKEPHTLKTLHKQILLLTADTIIVFLSHWAAAFLRFEGTIPQDYIRLIMLSAAISIVPVIALSTLLNSYRTLWRYVGIDVIFRQGLMSAALAAILLFIKYFFIDEMSGSISVIFALLLFLFTAGVRVTPRAYIWARATLNPVRNITRRAVIVGAGETGTSLIKRALETENNDRFNPVAIVDNDKNKRGTRASGIRIAGTVDDIVDVCKAYNATEIIVALPNIPKEDLFDVYKKCIKANLPIKSSQSLIDMQDYMHEDNTALKSITIEDLLFRDVVENDMTPVRNFLQGKTVLVTGGAGSIGSELCRQVLDCGCGLLIIFDINENGLYAINEEFDGQFDKNRYKLCLGSIRDTARLQEVMNTYKPYVVFHAAAHKHVPMLEENPFEAVKNNVKGTANVIEACIRNDVHKFILISTDKAVNPVNILGASKRVAELIVENQKGQGTELAAVRFGNVLGSIGSVIPKFKQQIAEGGPVTVTHRDIVRFFMTISEAVSLVLTAGTLAKDGEVFLLDMGAPVKIYDLATDLIRLSGYEPNVDIKIEITGLRPGEKLFEELFINGEQIDTTSHEKIFILNSKDTVGFEAGYKRLLELATDGTDEQTLREALFEMVRN